MPKKIVDKDWEDKDWYQNRNKWSRKWHYEVVRDTLDRFREMQEGRRTNCPLASPLELEENVNLDKDLNNTLSETGNDWTPIWSNWEKLWGQYKRYYGNRSNLKSPISFAPVEAAMAEFQDAEMGVMLTATEEDDNEKVMILQHVIEYLGKKRSFGDVNAQTFKEVLIFGSSWTYIPWIEKKREVELILSGEAVEKEIERLTDSEDEEDKKKLEKIDKKGRPATRKVTVTESDPALVNPSIYEIYVDPDARCLRGNAYEAKDIVWEQLPSVDQFRSEFLDSSDPFVLKKNVEKVRTINDARDDYDTAPFFKPPENISGDKVQLVRYYNKVTDKYIVVANDILVRYGPLPYNHKELPFAFHKAINWPQQFYGLGLPGVLESLQSEDEVLRNMMLDQLKLTLNPPMLINEEIYDDIDEGWEDVAPGQKIGVRGDVSDRNIRWMPSSTYRADYFQMRGTIREDAIMASGVNPIAYSVPKQGEAVRNNMMSLESTLKMLKKIMRNWSIGYKDAIEQVIALVMTKYPETKLEEIDGQSATVMEKVRKIVTTDIKLTKGDKGEVIEEREPGKFTFLLDDDEYFSLKGDVDVMVDVDRMLPMSTALKLQRLDKAMVTLIPIFTNPMMLDNPAIAQMVRDYVRLNELDPSYLDALRDENKESDIQDAYMHNEALETGQAVPASPGKSDAHLLIHTQRALELFAERESLVQEVKNDAATPEELMALATRLQQIEQTLQNLAAHMKTEQMPVQQSDEMVSDMILNSQQPPPPEAGPEGPMAGPPPEGMTQGAGPEQVAPEGMAPQGPMA